MADFLPQMPTFQTILVLEPNTIARLAKFPFGN